MLDCSFNIVRQEPRFVQEYGEIWRNGEELFLRGYLKPNQTILDVGANVGDWSLTALQIEPTLKLFCFEPIISVFSVLFNRLISKTEMIYNVAISDKIGVADFYYLEKSDSGLSSLYRRPYFKGFEKCTKVKLETLDHFSEMYGIGPIDLVKIDVEGGELGVLKGARNLIARRQIKAFQIEYGETYFDAGTTIREVMTILTQAGYLIFRIVPHGLMYMSQWEDYIENYSYCNYFCVLQSEMPNFPLMSL